ncbi:MAG: hypothetical protein E6R04_00210 [Spirochaetes bacterium]|nr:MAG: hypothetical protein E6R04_00210 [Spirochaetota bacterium]
MQQIRKITKETYGIEYDVQMGEYSNGSYFITEFIGEDVEHDYESYTRGIDASHPYKLDYSNVEHVDLTPEESIAKWTALATAVSKNEDYNYFRPFEKVDPSTGEYYYFQPNIETVLQDMYNKGLIPAGRYLVQIDW